jgi:hypothetical protein
MLPSECSRCPSGYITYRVVGVVSVSVVAPVWIVSVVRVAGLAWAIIWVIAPVWIISVVRVVAVTIVLGV